MKTPLAVVKDKHQSKEKLVDELAKVLVKQEDESKEDFKTRLLRVPNRKLLRLLHNEDRLRRAGGRDAVVDAILTKYARPKDGDFRNRLLALGTGPLLDRLRSAEAYEKRGRKNRGDAPRALEAARRARRHEKLVKARAARQARSA